MLKLKTQTNTYVCMKKKPKKKKKKNLKKFATNILPKTFYIRIKEMKKNNGIKVF